VDDWQNDDLVRSIPQLLDIDMMKTYNFNNECKYTLNLIPSLIIDKELVNW